jgi:hypothetical protein
MLLMFSIGMAIVMIDLFVAARFGLAYRDAKKPIPLLRNSVNLTELAWYGGPSEEHSCALHPVTGLLVRDGGLLVKSIVQVKGADARKPEPNQNAGWYAPEREFDRGLDRRPLTDLEVAELKSLTELRTFITSKWLLIGVWVFLGGILSVFDAKDPLPQSLVLPCWIGLLHVIGMHIYWNIDGFRFRWDCRGREVARTESEGRRIEFLPRSRIIWTEEGEPSPLRRGQTMTVYQLKVSKAKPPAAG